MKFAILLTFISLLGLNAYAKEEKRTISSFEFNSSRNAFFKNAENIHFLYPDSQEYIDNSKGVTLNTMWCWSKTDSDPQCKVLFMGDSDSVLLSVRTIHDDHSFMNRNPSYGILHWCQDSTETIGCVSDTIFYKRDVSKSVWLPKADSLLMLRLGSKADHLRRIRLIQEEETDRLWGLMEGLSVGVFVGLAAMIIELPISGLTHDEYNWNHVLFSSLGAASGYSVYRCLTYDTNPRLLRITINLKRF